VLEVLVIAGEDAGHRYTLDGSEVAIGRGRTRTGRAGEIRLSDPTVSSRQAKIRIGPEGAVVEHDPRATNPTQVNGHEIRSKSIGSGDRIQMGRVVLEVQAREGIALGDLTEGETEAVTETRRTQVYSSGDRTVAIPGPSAAEMTQVRPVRPSRGQLTVMRGIPDLKGRSFLLAGEKTTLGRSPGSDVVLPEPGVSRTHAEVCWEGGRPVLRHCSGTNPTFVNGALVESSVTLEAGDEIQLADRVTLRLDLEATERPTSPAPPGQEPGLMTVIEDQVRRDQEIEKEFGVVGSFLDIDIVDSYGLKARTSKPEYIIASFERFRDFARGVIEEFEGEYLNSNGDEVMSFFESPLQAVRAASALLQRLGEFNAKENLLSGPFRVRQGIHTGHCLVDRKRGIAYSDVLDVSGHLQKHADHDGLLVSQQTLDQLPEGLPFEAADPLPKEGIPTHRLVGSID
jgi:pSer/pThr/pTyr-binding forkhead associated (FHA) protein